ncbi:hypothetical protein JSY36_05115 [Bacillus sp. H-16]|uniref:GNAT family N-acetyltransferase n=1 Tax=Alteribacter salitolerans TaxID=2912333 RepID=UPI001963378E|nr:GNAT family N-acetyltransferase [Alteribacter salitolerans]MBM7095133.1 hypothetical protein [Alteribacter salitolerans]
MYKKNLEKLEHLKAAFENNRYYQQPVIHHTAKKEPVLLSVFTSSHSTVFYLFTLTGKDYYQRHQMTVRIRGNTLYIIKMEFLNDDQYRKGYGCLLLEIAEEYAREYEIKKIVSHFPSEDIHNYNRNVAFYKKNDFSVYGLEAVKKIKIHKGNGSAEVKNPASVSMTEENKEIKEVPAD